MLYGSRQRSRKYTYINRYGNGTNATESASVSRHCFYQTNKYFYLSAIRGDFWIEIKRLNELVNWMKHVNNVNCLKIEWQFEWSPPLRFSKWWTCGRTTHYTTIMQTNINWLCMWTIICSLSSHNWMDMLKYLNFSIKL